MLYRELQRGRQPWIEFVMGRQTRGFPSAVTAQAAEPAELTVKVISVAPPSVPFIAVTFSPHVTLVTTSMGILSLREVVTLTVVEGEAPEQNRHALSRPMSALTLVNPTPMRNTSVWEPEPAKPDVGVSGVTTNARV